METPVHPPSGLRLRWIDTHCWALRRLYALHRSHSPAHLQTGLLGEREALFHLRRSGYIIVARRWKIARLRGDIDLIAWHGSTLCFVEIKTRSRRDAFAAEHAVDHDKQRTLRRLARAYLNRIPAPMRPTTARFDVLSLYLDSPSTRPDFVLLQGAFAWA